MLKADDIKNEFLICSLCQNEFDEVDKIPRVLSCLHTFCQVCLNKMVARNIVKCPCCNTTSHLSQDGIQGLPKDVTRRHLIEFLKVKKRPSDIQCRDCPDDNTASDFCRDCYIFLCIECRNVHRRSLASRGHMVLSIDELRRSGPDVFKRKMKCTNPGHEGQPLDFYCFRPGCKILVCITCIVCDHDETKGHIIQTINDYHKRKTTKLQQTLEVMNENIKVSRSSVEQYKQDLINMDIMEYEADKDIEDSFSICQKALENRKIKLKEHFSSVCQSRKSDLQNHIVTLEHFVDDMSNARDFLQCILKHTDPTEFVTLHATFCKRLKSLAKHKIDVNLEFKMPVFEPVKMGEKFCNYINDMGSVSCDEDTTIRLERSQTDSDIVSIQSLRKHQQLIPINMERGQTDFGNYLPCLNKSDEPKKNNVIRNDPVEEVDLQLMSTSPVLGSPTLVIGDRTGGSTISAYDVIKQKTGSLNSGTDRSTLYKIDERSRITLSRSFDIRRSNFVRGKTDAGIVLPALSRNSDKMKMHLAKSLTELGASLYPIQREKGDKRIRNIVCPAFTYDEKTVHQYRHIVDGLVLKNDAGQKTSKINESNLKNFRGAIGSRSFKLPGKFYYEVMIDYVIKRTLDHTNMVFEVGFCRQNEIDSGYCIYNQEHGWSFSIQYCQEHQSLCQWCRHSGKCFAHVPLLSSVKKATEVKLRYGFLLDTDHKKWTIIDCESQKCFHKFQGVDCTRPLWPVFGCHWPSKVAVEMTLLTGQEISVLPNSL